jgi:methylisocitrate lyase
MDDALDRMQKAREMGANMGFVEGLTNEQEARLVVKTLSHDGWPLLLNHVTGGKTPVSLSPCTIAN